MKITQLRAIERRLVLRDASYREIANEIGVSRATVNAIACANGHKQQALNFLRFKVRAQNALLAHANKRRPHSRLRARP